ncbi:MAG: hypothetical protein LQ350_004814 [Teloschistes chrysophthalmus]|nr:MAG: hypothetical protein LQ350_004814 [Niorma chrysophthalma]
MSMSELRRQQYVIYLHDQILQIPKGYLKDATFVQIFEHLVMNLAAEQFPARTVNFTRACMEIIVVYCLTKKEASTAWLQSTEFERIEDLFQEFQAAASFIAENPLPQPPIWQATGKLTSETTAYLCDIVPLRAGGPWVAYNAANDGPHGGQGKYDHLEEQFRPYRLLHEAAELLFHPRTRTVEGVSMVEFLKDRDKFDEEQEKRKRIAEDLD